MLQDFSWQWLLLFPWYKKLLFYLCAQHTFVLFKYKAVVNSRTYLNSEYWLWRADICKLLEEAKNEIGEKQVQQNTCKGQTSCSTENTQKTTSCNALNSATRVSLITLLTIDMNALNQLSQKKKVEKVVPEKKGGDKKLVN